MAKCSLETSGVVIDSSFCSWGVLCHPIYHRWLPQCTFSVSSNHQPTPLHFQLTLCSANSSTRAFLSKKGSHDELFLVSSARIALPHLQMQNAFPGRLGICATTSGPTSIIIDINLSIKPMIRIPQYSRTSLCNKRNKDPMRVTHSESKTPYC